METPTRLELPAGVERPFELFVSGVPQVEGRDYELVGRTLVFAHPLRPERRMPPWRWFLLLLGVWSSYRVSDTVDLVHDSDGRRVVTSISLRAPEARTRPRLLARARRS